MLAEYAQGRDGFERCCRSKAIKEPARQKALLRFVFRLALYFRPVRHDECVTGNVTCAADYLPNELVEFGLAKSIAPCRRKTYRAWPVSSITAWCSLFDPFPIISLMTRPEISIRVLL